MEQEKDASAYIDHLIQLQMMVCRICVLIDITS